MQPPNSNPFLVETLLKQLSSFPLWVKQVIYVQLRLDLESILSKNTLDAFGPDDILQLHRPQLSIAGQRILDEPARKDIHPAILKLLFYADKRKTIIDICIFTQWNLEQCACFLLAAMEKELIVQPTSSIIMATIYYLAGKIRLGEYLLKIGRLSVEQLDQALRTQQYIGESLGERAGIGDVLINLGYVNKQDCEGILFLKEECRKHFTMDNLALSTSDNNAAFLSVQNKLHQAYDHIRQLQLQCQQLSQQVKQ